MKNQIVVTSRQVLSNHDYPENHETCIKKIQFCQFMYYFEHNSKSLKLNQDYHIRLFHLD